MLQIGYQLGASALVTSLTAGLSLLTPPPPTEESVKRSTTQSASEQIASQTQRRDLEESLPADERTTLLGSEGDTKTGEEGRGVKESKVSGGAFIGIVGFIAGCGALTAVFGYLRLPPFIGLKNTYYFVGALAAFESAFLFFSFRLPPGMVPANVPLSQDSGARRSKVQEIAKDLVIGFQLAKEREVLLAFATGFATRAQGVIVAAYLPLFINDVRSFSPTMIES